jgi:UDP-2-acetamido-3-amino-2,3-dideoxy-glucuronate N-acetyltransferase
MNNLDTTVKVIGDLALGDGSYVGPFSVLGFPAKTPTDAKNVESKGIKVGKRTGILSNVVVGEGTIIGDDVWIDHHCCIGCYTVISDNTYILYGARVYDRVKIGSNCWVAGFVCNDAVIEDSAIVMGTLIHRFVDAVMGVPEQSPVIRKNAFIGMNAIIIGGIEVGEGAYIAAGAILTKSALPGRLYSGVPAKNVGIAPHPFKKSKGE